MALSDTSRQGACLVLSELGWLRGFSSLHLSLLIHKVGVLGLKE